MGSGCRPGAESGICQRRELGALLRRRLPSATAAANSGHGGRTTSSRSASSRGLVRGCGELVELLLLLLLLLEPVRVPGGPLSSAAHFLQQEIIQMFILVNVVSHTVGHINKWN